MDPQLAEALPPALADLTATCPVPHTVRDLPDPPGAPYTGLFAPDGTGQGIAAPPDRDPATRLASVADQVQEWAVEALWQAALPAVWPHCPHHPNTHPLTARVHRHRAVWQCPTTHRTIAPIGHLPTT